MKEINVQYNNRKTEVKTDKVSGGNIQGIEYSKHS